MMFEFAEEIERLANIKVAGVGGAGGNAVGRMMEAGLTGIEFLAVNTDLQALKESTAHNAMQIGAQLTKGLGSGGNPLTGRAAAEEDREHLAAALSGADMVFVTAGMGGGTGTGASPVVADVARELGALTVGIVTRPFVFEGAVRMNQAEAGIDELRASVDTLIIIPNQKLLEVVPPHTSMHEAFRIADNVLYEATRGIYEIISRHDHVNLDFADVSTVMRGMGEAMMGTGRASGENRAVEAARAAISSPLLDNVDIEGSQAVLVNMLGADVGLQDTALAMQYIQEAAGPAAHVIFGYGLDDSLGNDLQVTVIATGFDAPAENSYDPAAARRLAARLAPQSEPTLDFESDLESEPEPVTEPEGEQVSETMAATEPEPEAESPVEPEERVVAFVEEPAPNRNENPGRDNPPPAATVLPGVEPLQAAMAAGGGEDLLARAAREGADPERANSSQPFLRRVGTRNIGEVEVPAPREEDSAQGRLPAAGLRPQTPGEDLNTPAYSRKYMD